ncbi:MAG: hypothetical protein JOZ41_19105, partial [Chloroflexi bacterium]|nr:hypothetical protein [Chloroflexota bacterium]
MRKSLVALTLLVATVFGVGYVIGQIRGVTPSSAASSRQTTQPPDGPRHAWGPHAAGQVTAINGNTVTIKPLANRPADQGASVTTVILAGTTQYATGPGRAAPTSATRDAVKVGSYIVAIGTLSSDGKTLTASRVMVLPSAPTGPG